MIKFVVGGDQESIREFLRINFERIPDIQAIELASNGKEPINAVENINHIWL
ncbi:hypothetical protein [Myxosarcina sp. GI1(2024)]